MSVSVAAFSFAALTSRSGACWAAEKFDNALDWVPENAAFFGLSLRLGEQHAIIANSKALEKLMQVPVIQTAWQIFQLQWQNPAGGPLEQARAILDQPENQELVALLKDMFSRENVYFGDESWGEVAELIVQSSDIMNYGPLVHQVTHHDDQDDALEAQRQAFRLVLNNLSANLDSLKLPNLVMAFRLSDRTRADNQLRRLEQLAKQALQGAPISTDSLRRVNLGGAEYLTFSISLDEFLRVFDLDAQTLSEGLKQIEKLPGQYDKLAERLLQMRLHLHLGVWNGYLVVSLGGSSNHLAALGTGPSLAGRPELAPVSKFRNERLIAVGYASQALLDKASSSRRNMSTLRELVHQGLADSALDATLKSRIQSDVDELSSDLNQLIPAMGAISALSFLTPRGVESYAYDWRKVSEYDASRPLSLLNHVGGQPIFAFVGRGQSRPGDYDILTKWVTKGIGYFQDVVLPQIPETERGDFNKFWSFAQPQLTRLDQANRQYLVPGFADGQVGFVLDAKITSKQWQKQMPESSTPLPMLEPALVVGVSDASAVSKGVQEYAAVARDVVEFVKKQPKANVPAGYQIPAPLSRAAGGGTLYWYALPAEAKLDAQIAPNVGLGKDSAVFAIDHSHSERLMAAAPIDKVGVLSNADRPLASAVYFNWPKFIDTLEPWIAYGVRNGQRAAAAAAGGIDFMLADPAAFSTAAQANDSPQVQMILDQTRQLLDVLKVFRTYTCVTYREGDAFVSHSEAHYQDFQ